MKYLLRRQRIISLLCIISVILGMSAVSPESIHAETATVTSGPYTFVKHGNLIQLSVYNESKNPTGDVCLEKTYRSSDENFWVAGIKETAFQKKLISSLIINTTNRTETEYYRIADKAFLGTKIGLSSGGSGSKAVFQGGSITDIGHNAFEGAKIKGDLIFDKINGEIYSYAFYNMEVAGKLVIKGSLNCLDDYALAGAKMKELYLTTDIKEIGTCAFKDTPIREFPLPDTLTKLGSKVFEGCVLEKIILPSSDQKREIAGDAFPDQSGLTIVIPKGLTDLSAFHFENYKNLTFQVDKSLSENSPVICWLKEHHFTYKAGENGSLITPGDISELTLAPTLVETPTLTPTETPIPTPMEIPTEIPTVIPTETPTATPAETPTVTPAETSTKTPTVTPTIQPTQTPTSTPTLTPTTKPTGSPKPTASPAETPTVTPTIQPTASPAETPSIQPTQTLTPTATPTTKPTEFPKLTETPAVTPTIQPTASPAETLKVAPAETPTTAPTEKPTATPTTKPTESPKLTETPKVAPAETPTTAPTEKPTVTPAETPTIAPTEKPTVTPTTKPTETPTEKPTATPAEKPTITPTTKPTETPTEKLTVTLAETPTIAPTEKTTETPSIQPTQTPTQVSQPQITSSETPTPIVTLEPTKETSPAATTSPKKHGHINKKDKVKFKLNNKNTAAVTPEPTKETSPVATASLKKSGHKKIKFKLNKSATAVTPELTKETSPAATASPKKSGHIDNGVKYKFNNSAVAVTGASKKTLKKLETVSVGNHVKNVGDEVFANHPKLKKIQFGTDSTKLGKKGNPPRQEADKEQEAVTQCYETAVFQNGFS